MLPKTRMGLITKLIKEVAETYSVETAIVEELLCKSLSEVFEAEFGYRVDAELRNGELSLIGRTSQGGIEKDMVLSAENLKKRHLEKVNELLAQKLDASENIPLLRKYRGLEGTIVEGTGIRKTGSFYYVKLTGIEGNVTGVCDLRYVSPCQRGCDLTGVKADYYVRSLGIEKLQDRCRVVVRLSRTSREFPVKLLEKLCGDSSLVVKCKKRAIERVCYLEVNKFIAKKHVDKLKEALPLETLVISKIRKEDVL